MNHGPLYPADISCNHSRWHLSLEQGSYSFKNLLSLESLERRLSLHYLATLSNRHSDYYMTGSLNVNLALIPWQRLQERTAATDEAYYASPGECICPDRVLR